MVQLISSSFLSWRKTHQTWKVEERGLGRSADPEGGASGEKGRVPDWRFAARHSIWVIDTVVDLFRICYSLLLGRDQDAAERSACVFLHRAEERRELTTMPVPLSSPSAYRTCVLDPSLSTSCWTRSAPLSNGN